jgi:hypothetical protein
LYLADHLNSFGLFQSMGTWPGPHLGRDDASDFLFRASCALVHLGRIEELSSLCLREFEVFEPQLNLTRDRIILGSYSVVALVSEIPPLLSTFRTLQNMILPMAARVLKTPDVALSLSDVVKKLHSSLLPEPIKQRTRQYWDDHGLRLKEYRDLDQHHDVIINNTFLEIRPERKLWVLLPDKPVVRRRQLFTYSERVNALTYLPTAFRAFHDYAEDVAKEVGCSPKLLQFSTPMASLGSMQPPKQGTVALIIEPEKNGASAVELSQCADGRLTVQKRQRPTAERITPASTERPAAPSAR